MAEGFDVAVRGERGAVASDYESVLGIDGAAGARVEGHGVLLDVADAFDDVDFSVLGPICAVGPTKESVSDFFLSSLCSYDLQCGPLATAPKWTSTGHVFEIEHDEGLIVRFCTFQAKRFSARCLRDTGVIDSHVHLIVIRIDKASALCIGPAQIVGESACCAIWTGDEIKFIEEVHRVVVLQVVAS